MCALVCNSCDVECVNKVTESIAVVFTVTVEDPQVWWKSVCTRFGKWPGHRSEDGVRELMDHDKYILEKLQFLERHIACMPSRQICSVSIKCMHHQMCQYISRFAMCKCKCHYIKLLNAM